MVLQILENSRIINLAQTRAEVVTSFKMNVGEVRVAEDTDFALLKVNLLTVLLHL